MNHTFLPSGNIKSIRKEEEAETEIKRVNRQQGSLSTRRANSRRSYGGGSNSRERRCFRRKPND